MLNSAGWFLNTHIHVEYIHRIADARHTSVIFACRPHYSSLEIDLEYCRISLTSGGLILTIVPPPKKNKVEKVFFPHIHQGKSPFRTVGKGRAFVGQWTWKVITFTAGQLYIFFPLPFDPLRELTLGDALHRRVASCDAVCSFTWRLPNPFRGEENPLVRFFALLLLRTCPVLIQLLLLQHPCCYCHGLQSSSSVPFLSPLNPWL